MIEVEYLTDKNGQLKAVVVPIKLWRKLFPQDDGSVEELSQAVEDYCLNKAMDEARESPLLSREEALAYWERVDTMPDEEIDTSDIPPLDEEFFANAQFRLPKRKVPITIRLDADVLTWFKSLGKGYQTHINAVLRSYVEAQRK